MAPETGVVHLGLSPQDKAEAVETYCLRHGLSRVVGFSMDKFRFEITRPHEWVDWSEVTLYRFFYRLLQEITKDTLLVVNECLRSQDRNCLSYNCIRHYLKCSPHVLVFQYLPLVDTEDDYMVLYDFATQSRWKRVKFQDADLRECSVMGKLRAPSLDPIQVPITQAMQASYSRERDKLFHNLGPGDPHTIPRKLHLLSGKAKLDIIDPSRTYVGRNNRFKLPNMLTYTETSYPDSCTVFEFCHNFSDFRDFLTLSGQRIVPVLVSDLKVDQWYLERYRDWAGRLDRAYAAILG